MIDWARVAEFYDEVGAEDFDEVVELFLEEVVEAMERIGPNAACDALENDFHSTKGSALNLGFRELADHCYQGEKAAAGGSVPRSLIDELPQLYATSLAQFKDGRGQLDTAA